MSDFFPARGCIYAWSGNSGGSESGFFSMEGLNTGKQGTSVVLLNGVDVQDVDIILPVVTLTNAKILYTFGSDFGNVRIVGEILLGPAGNKVSAEGMNTVRQFFMNNRVSELGKPVSVSLPGSYSLSVYLHGLRIGAPSPDTHVQEFVFSGMTADGN